MILLVLSICLVTELHRGAATGPSKVDDVMTTNKEQQREIVNCHNNCRRNVNPPASNMLEMVWSDEIAAIAQKWANGCDYNHSPKAMRKLGEMKLGENLFMSSGLHWWCDVIKAWDDEKKSFTYGIGATPSGSMVGHHTQVVWYRSFKVGCAVAVCPNQKLNNYYVCQYGHVGNMEGKLATPYTKGTPCGDCPEHCNQGLCTNPCEHDNKYSNCDDLMEGNCNESTLTPSCKASCYCQGKIR